MPRHTIWPGGISESEGRRYTTLLDGSRCTDVPTEKIGPFDETERRAHQRIWGEHANMKQKEYTRSNEKKLVLSIFFFSFSLRSFFLLLSPSVRSIRTVLYWNLINKWSAVHPILQYYGHDKVHSEMRYDAQEIYTQKKRKICSSSCSGTKSTLPSSIILLHQSHHHLLHRMKELE